MNYNHSLELNELMQKLRDKGFDSIVTSFLEHDNKVYTKRGRLNKSGACRTLNCKPKQLEDLMLQMREILKADMGIDDPEK